jgi:hypothetical protein
MKTLNELRKIADENDAKKHQQEEKNKIDSEKQKKEKEAQITANAIDSIPKILELFEEAVVNGVDVQTKYDYEYKDRVFKYKISSLKFDNQSKLFSTVVAEKLIEMGYDAKSEIYGDRRNENFCVSISI